jgi:RHS repeat-associated protein
LSEKQSHDYTYDAMNRREKATRENGEQWRYDYNARGEVTSGVKAKGTATNAALRTGMQFGYDYDLIGNRIEESVHSPAGLAVQDWTANAGNQITQREIASSRWLLGRVHPEADLTVTDGGTAQRQDWEFAVPVESTPAGAATWKQVTVTATREGAGENGTDVEGTLEGNQWFAANPENMSYDEDGNLSSDGRWSYQWDGENRLKVMQTEPGAKTAGVPARRLEFAYDAQGRRIRKLVQSFELAEGPYTTVKDHRYIYDGWNMVAEFEVQGTPELTGAYAWGRDISGTMTGAGGVGGMVLAQKPKTGWTYAPCYDGNGNVSAYVSAASGAVRAKFDYDPYGRPIWNELAGGEELPAYRFSTKYEDVETGLLYYGYRYYAPELGRWINRDPIEEEGGVNLYGMVGNDAVNRLDRLGLEGIDPEWWESLLKDINIRKKSF